MSSAGPSSPRQTPRLHRTKACDACRRAKLRCEGKEDPPCERCRSLQLECSFRRDPVEGSSRSLKRRLSAMEDQLEHLTRALTEPSRHIVPPAPVPQRYDPALPAEPSLSGSTQRVDNSVHGASAPFGIEMGRNSSAGSVSQRRMSTALSPHWESRIRQDPGGSMPRPHVDKHLQEHLHDPLFAAAIGQPSRFDPPDEIQSNGMGSFAPFSAWRESDSSKATAIGPGPPLDMLDPIDLGFCTEEEAERLFNLFFDKSHLFLPVFEPLTDTLSSLQSRSPFAVTVILLVALLSETSSENPSKLQTSLHQLASSFVGQILFQPVTRIETLQALTVLACWMDSGWKLAALAVSIGMDMDIHTCLPWLDSQNKGSKRKLDQVKNERSAVLGARVWLALYKLRHEYAFNLGRPLTQDAEDGLSSARRFVDHPMANLGDCRLVSACEFLKARLPLSRPYGLNGLDLEEETQATIRSALSVIQSSYSYWEMVYTACGVDPEHTVRGLLMSEQATAQLHSAARTLSTQHYEIDLFTLSEEKRMFLQTAFRAAERLVHQCLHEPLGRLYTSWNHEQRVGVCFAASYLVNLARLLPDLADPEQVRTDVERLAALSANAPGEGVRDILRRVLDRRRWDQSAGPPIEYRSPNGIDPLALHIGMQSGESLQDGIPWDETLTALLLANDPIFGNTYPAPPVESITGV